MKRQMHSSASMLRVNSRARQGQQQQQGPYRIWRCVCRDAAALETLYDRSKSPQTPAQEQGGPMDSISLSPGNSPQPSQNL